MACMVLLSLCRQSPPTAGTEYVRRVSLRLRNMSPGGEVLPAKPPKEPLFSSPEVVRLVVVYCIHLTSCYSVHHILTVGH